MRSWATVLLFMAFLSLTVSRSGRQSILRTPGCFATTIQLGLPFGAGGFAAQGAYTTRITGSTGAGQSLTATSHFSWRVNIQAYKTSLTSTWENPPVAVAIAGWRNRLGAFCSLKRVIFTRGIFCELTVEMLATGKTPGALWRTIITCHPFTHVSPPAIFLKQVVNTNRADYSARTTG